MDDMTSDKKLLRVVEKTDILLYIINSKKKISTWPEFPILKPKPWVFSNRNSIKLKT